MKTSATKEKATTGLVPKLRFPEFREATGWGHQIVGPYLEDCSGRVPPDTTLPVYSSTREGLKRQDAYFDGQVLQNKNEYGVVPPACFVYRHMSDDGVFKFNINETGGDIAVSKEYPVFRTRGLNPSFLLAKLNDGLDFKRFAISQKAGGTRTRLNFSRLCEWRTLLPSPAEQQKIADCLGSLDELITAQGRKVEALKTHKKGLMQQLFPREGETQPRLRFPQFKNSEEWRELPLAALAEKIMVGIASAATHAYRETGVPMLRNQNIKEGGIDDSSLLFIDPAYEVAHKNKRLRAGDVITVRTGYPGLSAVVTQRHHNAQCFTSLITRPKKDVLSPDYLSVYINSDIGKRFIMGAEAGGAQKNVNAGALEALPVHLPALDEQKRIASFMSSLDVLIAAAVKELDAIKTHKQGLMQQLFPSAEAHEA